ncbi:DUF4832 domain-containing protein [Mycobacterium hubeiense]|uniref:DUF4832 domain-containing protein n=1 Tax=Mycobacterium hubeiense TaxID=1867256 RepID=UPI001E509569|nr:DUF4832 domain-containing protein [Mycobacterium sp. QGD 101]
MQAAATALVVALAVVGCGSPDPEPAATGIMPFTAPDLVNPLRGQYENLATPLFPQGNPAQDALAPWPGTTDMSLRIDWRTLQPHDPRNLPRDVSDAIKFDFSVIDRALATAASSGRRIGLRVTAFNSCCDSNYPNGFDISVPDWLRTIPGATHTYRHAGVSYVIPDWNNKAYLLYFADLLAALGRRYDRNERLALVEMSGYGDFSENHNAFMRDTLGIPGPAPELSERELGYFSQYRDQYITKDSIAFLVNANLAAFPNTQMIGAIGNPEITKQLFRDSALLRGRAKPVGIRADGLGAFRPIPTWAAHRDSRYVQMRDPIVDVVANRFRTAPIVTEWIPNPPPTTNTDYYLRGLRDVVNDHVSMTASTGFPHQLNDDPMPRDQFDMWSRANKFSGYRYAVVGIGGPEAVPSSSPVTLNFRWTNFGSAPAYERWQPEYEVVSASGQVIRTLPAGVDLRSLVADQHFQDIADVPAAKSVVDVVTVEKGLPPGRYTVRARVVWHEHKPNASNTVDFPPMQLAQYGRDGDGGYPVAAFTVQ